jgi:hypothetical protein
VATATAAITALGMAPPLIAVGPAAVASPTPTTGRSVSVARVRTISAARPARRNVPGDPGTADLHARAVAALAVSVSRAWGAAVSVKITVIDGNTSWSSSGGVIRFGRGQLVGSWDHARFIATHEWGHQVAFLYGSQADFGAPPDGFPYHGRHPEEVWADCVARTLTGLSWPTDRTYPRCDADLAGWAGSWLAPGPGARTRTG